jgi:uncharacterized membrane protein YcjF (UPF0283 family)
MIEGNGFRWHHALTRGLLGAGALVCALVMAGIAAQWLWNTLAHRMLAAPKAGFVEGLALAVLALLVARPWRGARHHHAITCPFDAKRPMP